MMFFIRHKAAGAWSWPPPPSADVKNEWSYNSIPPTRPHGVDRKNFYLSVAKSITYFQVSESDIKKKSLKLFSYKLHVFSRSADVKL